MLASDTLSLDLLETIYRLKTGALFEACIELGWLASHDEDDMNQRALHTFGRYIGLAFQIQDDILDEESTTAELGKQQGIDLINKKTTYPRIAGMQAAKDKVQFLYQQALESINYLGDRANLLRELAGMMLERRK
jgi:geranylgeranyl pyrophosphate synthase